MYAVYCKILFIILLIGGNCGFAQNYTITMDNIQNAILLYYEGIEAAAKSYWEEGYIKLQKALESDPQHQHARLDLQILSDIIDSRLEESVGKDIFEIIIDYTFQANLKTNKQIDAVIENLDSYVPVQIYKGLIEENLKNSPEALTAYNMVLKLDPSSAYGYYLRGKLKATNKRFIDGIADLTTAIKLDSLYFGSFYYRGNAYHAINQIDLAIQNYEKAYYLNPTLKKMLHESLRICEGYNSRGVGYLKNKQYQKALNDFNTAIHWNSIFNEPYLNRGVTYRLTQLYDSAISDFNKVIELDSNNVQGLISRGLTYKINSKADLALKDFEKVVRLEQENTEAYQNIGEIPFISRTKPQSHKDFCPRLCPRISAN